MNTPFIFNHFAAGACVKVIDRQVNILVVSYYDSSDHKKINEIRLPGGTIQCVDILTALEKTKNRNGLSLERYSWIYSYVEEINRSFRAKTDGMPKNSNFEKIQVRNEFTVSMSKIEEAFDSLFLSEPNTKMIQRESIVATLNRELEEETATTKYSAAIASGFMERKGHFQYPYLILDSDAPDSYEGSSDPDIKESFYMPLLEVKEALFKNHIPFLRNALTEYCKVLIHQEGSQSIIEEIDLILKLN